MIKKRNTMLPCILLWFLFSASAESNFPGQSAKDPTNIAHATDTLNLSGIASIFSPRMDFDQWKPLTGRGDPLRNDPTYDYEPPVLERVHYWADENRPQREKIPERKSEVLVLGVSSRKPSVGSRPPTHARRPPRPSAFPSKYEDFSYKFSDHFPMTILVPPPPPPPGLQPSPFVISKEKVLIPTAPPKLLDVTIPTRETTTMPEYLTSFALQESNLIYQASTTKENWFHESNKTTNLPNNTVSSDYAGWGPTTPFEDINEAHNIISHTDHHNVEFTKQPLFYYKPMLSEAPPPPPPQTSQSLSIHSFLPTVPPTLSTVDSTQDSSPPIETTQETTTESQIYYETTTEKIKPQYFQTTPELLLRPKPNIIDMLGSMISMPMVTDPNRPEDNLYAHASDTIQVFKEPASEDSVNLDAMQTMQPPPPVKFPESSTAPTRQEFHVNPHILNSLLNEKPMTHTHDPYLHMRFTTPAPTTLKTSQDIRSTTETPAVPTYLIIQGHSKVKTYGSKPKPVTGNVNNEIPNPNETNEVKHLHPIKDKNPKKSEKIQSNRGSRSQNLMSLVDNGLGSIEIQEADVGIKYDVSDGSEVPVEIYRKGIVDNDENNYSSKKIENRNRRQIDLENILPFGEDSLEEFVYNIFESRKNETGITGLIAQEITDDSSSSLEDIDDEREEDDKDR